MNVLIAVGAMAVGFVASPGTETIFNRVTSCVALALLVAAANVHNDVVDVEVDRINAPWRPLVTEAISARAAWRAAVHLYTLAMLVGATLGGERLLYLALMMLIVWLYNIMLKGTPLGGNLCVALLCALAVYFPEFPALPRETMPGLVIALLTNLPRELIKDIEDLPGDGRLGLRTFPVALGPRASARVAAGLTMTLLAWLPVPVACFHYGRVYAVLALAGIAIPACWAILELTRCTRGALASARRKLKWSMAGGMLAVTMELWSRR